VAGEQLTWGDVVCDENDLAVQMRREMEAAFGRVNVAAATSSAAPR
jgi:hypothetical protein